MEKAEHRSVVGSSSAFTLRVFLCSCSKFGFIVIALSNMISLYLFLSIFFTDTHASIYIK